MASRLSTSLGAVLLAFAWSGGAASQALRIQFAEKVALDAAPGRAEFDAYGRRFSLDLQPNDRLVKSLGGQKKLSIDTGRLLRGTVMNAPRSWVRIARVGDGLEGAIWDGHDLYVVTSKRNVEAQLTMPLEGAPSQTVVYRLSDTLGGLPAGFCGVEVDLPASPTKAPSGLEQYKSMVEQLRVNAAALTLSEQLDLSVIADSDFQNYYGQLARDSMLARINTVDGIFSEQVGVLIAPTELRMIPAASDPFTTNDADALLNQLSTYREATPAVRAAGLAHLMTGKVLAGTTVGIAYRDSLCDSRRGASLSDRTLGSFYSALVMAHELGHNFGAPHDGTAGSACATTSQTFLMSPTFNYSSTFSACSLAQMQDSIARARGVCIGPLHYADLGVTFPASPLAATAQEEFGFPITIRSVGTETARGATLRVDLPSPITYRSAVLANGSCSVTGSTVTCQLGDVAANETRLVELRLVSSSLGSYNVAGKIAADNDYSSNNDSGNAVVGSLSPVDLGVQVAASATSVYVTDAIDFTIDVSSLRTQAAHGGRLFFSLDSATAIIDSIANGAHACALDPGTSWSMRCNLADVPSGTSTRVVVHAHAVNPGTFQATATVTVDNDGDPANNTSYAPYSIRAEREIVTAVSTENLRAVVGSPYDVVYTLTSVGRAAVTDVVFTAGNPLGAVESVVTSVGACTTPGPGMSYSCNFGALAPGDVRTVTVRLRFATTTSATLVGSTNYTNGSTPANTAMITWIYANLRLDAQARIIAITSPLESYVGSGLIELQSVGIDPAQNVVATLDLPDAVRLQSLQPVYNPQGFQCAIVLHNQARCTGSYGVVGQDAGIMRVQFDFISSTPVSGPARLSLTADNDGNPSNDVSTQTLTVRPYIDTALQLVAPPAVVVMNVGEVTPVNLALTSNKYPASNVYVTAVGSSPWYRVDSISVNGADCPRAGGDLTEFGNFYCAVGDLPANANYPVIVRYRAMRAGLGTGMSIFSGALDDADTGNSYVGFNARTQQLTDVGIRVADATATAMKGSSLRYPLITVSNAGAQAEDVVVNVPLPAFASVDTISSSGNCAGTSTLSCVFDSIAAGASATIDIKLSTAAEGTFTSNVTMTADNDSTTTNNTTSVALSVTAPPAPPPPPSGSSSGGGSSSSSSGGGGKGGGRMEWLALVFLGLMAWRRIGRSSIGVA